MHHAFGSCISWRATQVMLRRTWFLVCISLFRCTMHDRSAAVHARRVKSLCARRSPNASRLRPCAQFSRLCPKTREDKSCESVSVPANAPLFVRNENIFPLTASTWIPEELKSARRWYTSVSQASILIKPQHRAQAATYLEDHLVRAVSLLEGELGVEVRLQQGVGHGGQHPCVYRLLVGLALVRHRRALLGQGQE